MKPTVQSLGLLAAQRGIALVVAGLCLCGGALAARANVFASNVRLDGVTTNLAVAPGASVTVDYRLNQPADAGVKVAVAVGTNIVWSTNLTAATGGTNRGLNSVVWNGCDTNGNIVSNGLWQIRVTPASAGGTNWAQVAMADNSLQTLNGDGYVWAPQGIGVNNNTHSPHFGRIFVGNAEENPDSTAFIGEMVGIAKYNADGTYAEEGGYSTGGWPWAGDGTSPGKIEVGADDRVYVVDGASPCTVLSFDQLITTNTPAVLALQMSNLLNAAVNYAGLAVTGSGTNRKILMSDIRDGTPGGVGVRRWNIQTNGAAGTNDVGVTVVADGSPLDLDAFPQDVAVDSSNRIFVIQRIGGVSPRVLGYPAYPGNALSNAMWTVADPSVIDASGVAAALHTNWLAVVCRTDVGNAISIYNRDTGAAIGASGLNSGATYLHDYTDAAWDRAGNLYVTDWMASRWRVFSPPGANQFTTTALQTIKVGPYVEPMLLALARPAGQFQFQLKGEPGVAYAIETSTNLITWSGVTTNLVQIGTSVWTVPAPAGRAFFRARIVP